MKKFLLTLVGLMALSVSAQTTYVAIKTAEDLEAGAKYILVANAGEEKGFWAMGASNAANPTSTAYRKAVEVTENGGVCDIANVTGVAPFSLVAGTEAGSYAIQLESGSYITFTGTNSNNLKEDVNLTKAGSFTISFNDDGTALIINADKTARALKFNYNNGTNPRYANYSKNASTSQPYPYIYKLNTSGVIISSPAFSVEAGTVEAGTTVEITCATTGAEIYYTLDGTNPSKASTKYEGAIPINETTTIKAIAYVGEDESGVSVATYTVVDPNKPGATIDNPMNVEQAIAACEAGAKGVYVKGVVTEIVTTYSTQYQNVTFNIADEAGATATLQAFRAVWGEGVTPTADKNPEIGATVVLYGDLTLYKEKGQLDAGNQIVAYTAPELPSAGLSFPEASYTINLGESFTAPVLTKDTDAAVAYTSSNTTVADVDAATGAVTVKTYGSAIITAKTEATSAYLAGEASYTLVVNNPNITLENPLTVAEALEVCENNPHNVYVKGVVTEIVTNYSTQYKNVTFNIADEAGNTNVLEAYRAVWGEDVTPTTDNNPEIGATVVLYGNLKVYKDKKEFDAGNMIVKYESPDLSGIDDIEAADNAPVEYFNLQGVRVANPENGLFIRRQGNKVSKVIVK